MGILSHSDEILANQKANLVYVPSAGDLQKHTFSPEYLSSPECQVLVKIAFSDVTVGDDAGNQVAFAKMNLKKGDVVERGILRSIDGLDNSANNPHVIRLGEDFESTRDDFHHRHPFLSSGLIALYRKAMESYNIEMQVSPTGNGSFEFQAVAVEDISDGAMLIRRAFAVRFQDECSVPYAEAYNMSDADVEHYIAMRSSLDLEDAAKAGIEPDTLHAEALREHVRSTREGRSPVTDCSKTVVLPHPSWGGYGAFAAQDIKAGEVIEWGLMRAINGLDGDKCTYVFTWNSDGRRKKEGNLWCMGGSNSMFWNSDNPANARMYRLYNGYRYLIVAKRDIRAGEEVMHLYASSSWRKCFVQDEFLPKLLPVEDENH